MRRLALFALLLIPAVALAEHPCEFHAERKLDLDLNGVRSVQIEVRSHQLHVAAAADAQGFNLVGRACASDQKTLDTLIVTQERQGDRLIVTLGSEGHFNMAMFHSQYADLDVKVKLPAQMPLQVNVGSGDAEIRGAASLESNVGSGDLNIFDLAGAFRGRVGSGDIHAERVGSVDMDAIGSGDFKASDIRGDARFGSVGSGDVDLTKVGGNVTVSTIGSGDLRVDGVHGNLVVQTKGSGDVDHRNVTGSVNLPRERD
jgi:Putative adhesin